MYTSIYYSIYFIVFQPINNEIFVLNPDTDLMTNLDSTYNKYTSIFIRKHQSYHSTKQPTHIKKQKPCDKYRHSNPRCHMKAIY
jgi:hypothetical protein